MKLRFRNLLAVVLVLSFSSMSVYPQLNRSKQIEKPAKTESSQFRQLEETDDRKDSFWTKVLSDVSEAKSRRVVKRQATLESPAGGSVLVTNLNDSGPGSLRQALIDVPISGIIYFDESLSGTIQLNTGSLVIDKPLTIWGPGARQIAVDGFDLKGGSVFVIDFPDLPPPARQDSFNRKSALQGNLTGTSGKGLLPVEIIGLTISGGRGTALPPPLSRESTQGISYYGGGIFADIQPGYDVALLIGGCFITGNGAALGGDGGGVYLRGVAAVSITNSTFYGNTASNGGGLFIDESGQTTILNSTFSNNIAFSNGGAIYRTAINQVVGIGFSTISGNFAASSGGGVYSQSIAPMIGSGEAIELPTGDPEIGALQLLSTLIAGNTLLGLPISEGTNGVMGYPDADGVFSAEFSLIGIVEGAVGITNGVAGNLAGNLMMPLDPQLGPLQNNGGPTDTMALASTSPAIDAGAGAGIVMNTDQRGALRPWYPTIPTPFPGLGDGSDIGAYEYMFTTASGVSVAGRISDDLGRSISGANVSVMDSETGATKTVKTNQFGRYNVEGLIAGRVFVVSVSSKSSKDNPVQILNLAESLGEINFTLSRR